MLAGILSVIGSGDADRNEAGLESGSIVTDTVGGQLVSPTAKDFGDVAFILLAIFQASEISISERNHPIHERLEGSTGLQPPTRFRSR